VREREVFNKGGESKKISFELITIKEILKEK
jgi:hypothetical protein